MPQTNCPNTKANNTPFQGLLKSAAAKKKKKKINPQTYSRCSLRYRLNKLMSPLKQLPNVSY